MATIEIPDDLMATFEREALRRRQAGMAHGDAALQEQTAFDVVLETLREGAGAADIPEPDMSCETYLRQWDNYGRLRCPICELSAKGVAWNRGLVMYMRDDILKKWKGGVEVMVHDCGTYVRCSREVLERFRGMDGERVLHWMVDDQWRQLYLAGCGRQDNERYAGDIAGMALEVIQLFQGRGRRFTVNAVKTALRFLWGDDCKWVYPHNPRYGRLHLGIASPPDPTCGRVGACRWPLCGDECPDAPGGRGA